MPISLWCRFLFALFVNKLLSRSLSSVLGIVLGVVVGLSACTQQKPEPPSLPAAVIPVALTPVSLAPLSQWQHRAFVGETQYRIQYENNEPIIEAVSEGSASMIYQRLQVDLTKTPYVNWQWRVDRIFSGADETTKAGDDFAARVYIAVKNTGFSLFPRALNYVWANQSAPLSTWQSPYTAGSIMMAMQGGDDEVGKWVSEKRNLREDLKRVFNEDITQIEGIALMTDSDNTGQVATGFYRRLFFSKN